MRSTSSPDAINVGGGEGLSAPPLNESLPILPIEVSRATAVEPLVGFAVNNTKLPKSKFDR